MIPCTCRQCFDCHFRLRPFSWAPWYDRLNWKGGVVLGIITALLILAIEFRRFW